MAVPTLKYGCESWVLKEKSRLQAAEMRVLRMVVMGTKGEVQATGSRDESAKDG